MRRRIGTAVATALMFGAFAFATGVAHATVGSTSPATPQIGAGTSPGGDGHIEVARQITQCGNVMYVGGDFTQVRNPNSNTAIARNNAFAFSATAPHTVLPWNPNVNGVVDTVGCAPDGGIYVGGQFTTVGGVAVRNLAKVDGVTGANQATFTLHPAGRVAHVEVVIDQGGVQHLLVGGFAAPFLRSVVPLTGAAQTYLPANLAHHGYLPVHGRVGAHDADLQHVGPPRALPARLDDGEPRRAHDRRLHLRRRSAPRADLPAQPDRGHGHGQRLVATGAVQPLHRPPAVLGPGRGVRADMSAIYVVTTGFHLWDEQRVNGQWRTPRTGPCDAAISFPSPRPSSAAPARGTTGSTTRAATRCTRSRSMRRRCSSAVTSGGSATPAATRWAPAGGSSPGSGS